MAQASNTHHSNGIRTCCNRRIWLKLWHSVCAQSFCVWSVWLSYCLGILVVFTKQAQLCDTHRHRDKQTLTTTHTRRVQHAVSRMLHLAYEILTPTVLCMWRQQLGSCTNNTGGNLILRCLRFPIRQCKILGENQSEKQCYISQMEWLCQWRLISESICGKWEPPWVSTWH